MEKYPEKQDFFDIGCAANDKYAQHMGVMMYSLLKNCSSPHKVRFFVVDSNITLKNKKNLKSISEKFGATLIFLTPDLTLLRDLKTYYHLGLETYLRFPLLESISSKKILYLDCDIVVLGDIAEIFGLKFENSIIFAVKDPGISERKKKNLGIKNKYFNAGVMLINVEKWKNFKVTLNALKYLKENTNKIEFADQDALNVVLKDSWKELDPTWNVITRFFYSRIFPWIKIYDYNNSEIFKVRKNPKIIHFATTIKPWFFLDLNPQKKIYWHYLRKTPWKEYKSPDSTIIGLFKRLASYIKFILLKISYLSKRNY